MDNRRSYPDAPLAEVPTGLTIPIRSHQIVDTCSGHLHETFTLLGFLSPNRGSYPQIVADLSTMDGSAVTHGQVADSHLSPKSRLEPAAMVTGLAQ